MAVSSLAIWVQAGTSAWQLVSSSDSDLGGNLHYLERQLEGRDKCLARLVVFDEATVGVEVVANTSKADAKWLRELALSRGAIAGCNGGYFDPPKMLPACLEIAGGASTGTYGSTGPTYGSVFGVRDGKLFIESEAEFQSVKGVTQMIQCSPILMQEGRAHRCGGDVSTGRTFIATNGQGRWAIATASRARLNDLADFMDQSETLLGFKVTRAMNLDGGPSTALWCQDAKGEVHDTHEGWKVRNVVLVIPTAKPSPK